jgi:hypothetical protein
MNISSVSAPNPVTSLTPVDTPKAQGTTANSDASDTAHQPTPPPPLPPGQGTRVDQLV